MKMSAGYEFHQRNPRLAPTRAPQKSSVPQPRARSDQLQVVGEFAVRRDVSERGERRGRDREHADRQAIEAVGQVDRVGRPDQDQRREGDVEPADVGNEPLEEREIGRVL